MRESLHQYRGKYAIISSTETVCVTWKNTWAGSLTQSVAGVQCLRFTSLEKVWNSNAVKVSNDEPSDMQLLCALAAGNDKQKLLSS